MTIKINFIADITKERKKEACTQQSAKYVCRQNKVKQLIEP